MTSSSRIQAEEPLHVRVDKLILASGKPAAELVDDAGFIRRVYLDFSAVIPNAKQVRSFVDDRRPDKRQRLIDLLLNGPLYPLAMAEKFHVVLM